MHFLQQTTFLSFRVNTWSECLEISSVDFNYEFSTLVKLRNWALGHRVDKICICDCITSIGQRDSRCIGPKVFYRCIDGQKVTRRLRHLHFVQKHVAIEPHRFRHHFLAKDRHVIEEHVGQMIGEQIFSWGAQIHRVPVHELVSHYLQLL